MISFTPINYQKIPLGDGWNLNVLSKSIATITDPKGKRKTSYFGFDTKEKALEFMAQHRSQVSAAIVRESQRLSQYAWECKIWQCPTELILSQLNQQSP
ncbi:hypothetical protein NIES2119_29990 [[Phormidium ambiguum] IAM M-71]|uniref:Uncharacterized protein n=1 Tax=[Phormidium ambiguum] IAM M-71 TaxID=454136 RepID=A0A1U7I475_9CYAN|nr:hypothetical protein [Phormidium ambiguum]OKH30906.1 hypothetical protein NIES2119_29990 [Phormidium ambiguum IAM M-71]